MEQLMSPQQLARALNVSVRTVYAWRQSGNGPAATVVGRHLRYDPAAVRSWLAAGGSAREPVPA